MWGSSLVCRKNYRGFLSCLPDLPYAVGNLCGKNLDGSPWTTHARDVDPVRPERVHRSFLPKFADHSFHRSLARLDLAADSVQQPPLPLWFGFADKDHAIHFPVEKKSENVFSHKKWARGRDSNPGRWTRFTEPLLYQLSYLWRKGPESRNPGPRWPALVRLKFRR